MPNSTTTTVERLREFVTKDMDEVLYIFEQRIASEAEMMNRLTWVFGDDAGLARTVYNYVVLGHLSHHNYLRKRVGEKNDE